MPRTIRTKVYKFSELSDKAKQKALEIYRDVNVDYNEWWDFVEEDFNENIASPAGFDVDKIYFSGFWSQGDGAMFEGSIKDFAPFLSDINRHVAKAIKAGSIELRWSVEHRGHYYHEYCSEIYFEPSYSTNRDASNIQAELEKIEENIKQQYYTLCRELYRMLENAYNDLTSDESVIDTIEANEYEFTIDGKRSISF